MGKINKVIRKLIKGILIACGIFFILGIGYKLFKGEEVVDSVKKDKITKELENEVKDKFDLEVGGKELNINDEGYKALGYEIPGDISIFDAEGSRVVYGSKLKNKDKDTSSYDLNIYDAEKGNIIKIRQITGNVEVREAKISKEFVCWIERDESNSEISFHVKNYNTGESILDGKNATSIEIYENKLYLINIETNTLEIYDLEKKNIIKEIEIDRKTQVLSLIATNEKVFINGNIEKILYDSKSDKQQKIEAENLDLATFSLINNELYIFNSRTNVRKYNEDSKKVESVKLDEKSGFKIAVDSFNSNQLYKLEENNKLEVYPLKEGKEVNIDIEGLNIDIKAIGFENILIFDTEDTAKKIMIDLNKKV